MLTIEIPSNYQAERRYILSVIFTEFLGLDYQLRICDRVDTKITLKDNCNCALIVADKFFNTSSDNWLKPNSLPRQPLAIWDIKNTQLKPIIVSSKIPVIYGNNPDISSFFEQSNNRIYLGLDIFGSAFFMLTRYEEIIKPDRDKYDRFPAQASLAYQEGFLERPIINEYVEILWSCLLLLDQNQLKRKIRQFKIALSHDVDNPFKYKLMNVLSITKLCGGDIFKRWNFIKALNNFVNWIMIKTTSVIADPYYSFELIMNISEKYNIRSAFFFICGSSESDPRYDVNNPQIRKLIKQIATRGHEIGLHPSYDTYLQPVKLNTELSKLTKILEKEGISEINLGGRQHYLRWKAPETWQSWDNLNLKYDSSVGYAEHIGFRCGCCYEYSVFNCINRQTLKLRERPLIVMECSLFSRKYMGLSYKQARPIINKVIDNCQLFQGSFTMLWHNNQLVDKQGIDFYLNTVKYALFKN